jgi:hypothetical protein
MFRVLVPVVQEVEKAMSLLQKYISRYLEPTVEEEGEEMLRDAEPVGVRYPILEPTG